MHRVLTSALLVLTAAGLTGCASYRVGPPNIPPKLVAIYRCADGQVLKVTFDNSRNDARVRLGDGAIMTLQGQPTGSGIHYANATHDLRGKGREATFEIKGGASTSCLADA